MADLLDAVVLDVLRVPPEPSPPAGEAGSLQVFRAAPNYFRYRQLVWGIRQAGALAALLFGLFFVSEVLPNLKNGELIAPWVGFAEALAWTLFVVQLPFTYAVLRLDYRLRWYMVTDRSLRVREGIVSLREKTMTFANIQNLSVEQGPLQRLLGLADVKVRTAGGGSAPQGEAGVGESPHEARFRGVDNATEIRDLLRDRVRRFRDAGLGDTDDPVVRAPSPVVPEMRSAAVELLTEVRELRAALNPRG